MNFQIYKYKYISFGSSIEDFIYITTEKLPKKNHDDRRVLLKRNQTKFIRLICIRQWNIQMYILGNSYFDTCFVVMLRAGNDETITFCHYN